MKRYNLPSLVTIFSLFAAQASASVVQLYVDNTWEAEKSIRAVTKPLKEWLHDQDLEGIDPLSVGDPVPLSAESEEEPRELFQRTVDIETYDGVCALRFDVAGENVVKGNTILFADPAPAYLLKIRSVDGQPSVSASRFLVFDVPDFYIPEM